MHPAIFRKAEQQTSSTSNILQVCSVLCEVFAEAAERVEHQAYYAE